MPSETLKMEKSTNENKEIYYKLSKSSIFVRVLPQFERKAL
jgi:hypothetical protein